MADTGFESEAAAATAAVAPVIGDTRLAEAGTECLSAAYDASQGLLALGYSTGHVSLQHLGHGGRHSTFPVSAQGGGLTQVLLPPSLGVLVAADTQSALWVFDTSALHTCFSYRVPGEGGDGEVTALCWVTGTHWVCVGTAGGRAYFVDVVAGRKSDFSIGGGGSGGAAVAVACHPVEAERLLVAYAGGECRVYDLGLAANDERAALVGRYAAEGRVVDAVWSPDGRRIACAADDGAVGLFDVAGGGKGKRRPMPQAPADTLRVARPSSDESWRVTRVFWPTPDGSDAPRLLALSSTQGCAWLHDVDGAGRPMQLDGGPGAAACLVARASPWRNGAEHVRGLVVAGGAAVRWAGVCGGEERPVDGPGRVALVQAPGGGALCDARRVWTAEGRVVARVDAAAEALGVRGAVCALAWREEDGGAVAVVAWDSGEAAVLAAPGAACAGAGDAGAGAAAFYAGAAEEEENDAGREVRVRAASVGGAGGRRRRSTRLASLGQRLFRRTAPPGDPADAPSASATLRPPVDACAWRQTQHHVQCTLAHTVGLLPADHSEPGLLAPAAVLRLCRRRVRHVAVGPRHAAVAYAGGTLALFDWRTGALLLVDNPGHPSLADPADVCKRGSVEITCVAFVGRLLVAGTQCGWVVRYAVDAEGVPADGPRVDVHAAVRSVDAAEGCVVVATAAGVTAYAEDFSAVVGRRDVDALLAAACVRSKGWHGVAAVDRRGHVALLRLPCLLPEGAALAVPGARALARQPAADVQVGPAGVSVVVPGRSCLQATLAPAADAGRAFYDAGVRLPPPPARRTVTSWLFSKTQDPAPDIDGFLGARFRDLIARGAGTRPAVGTKSAAAAASEPAAAADAGGRGGVLAREVQGSGAFAGMRAAAERRGQMLEDVQDAVDRANTASATYLAEIRAYNARQEKKAKLFGLF